MKLHSPMNHNIHMDKITLPKSTIYDLLSTDEVHGEIFDGDWGEIQVSEGATYVDKYPSLVLHISKADIITLVQKNEIKYDDIQIIMIDNE